MKSKHLILFTSNFPFDKGEPFLETEIEYLSGSFEKITIVTQNEQGMELRPIPENCEVVRKSFELNKTAKPWALGGVFNPMFKSERRDLKTMGVDMNIGVLKTLLISLFRARRIANVVQEINDSNSEYQNYYYSYWGDDVAVALAIFRKENAGVKCFTRVHGWDVYFEASEVGYLPFRRFIAKQLDAVIAISDAGKDYCLKRWNVEDENKVSVSRLGVKEQQGVSRRNQLFTLVSCSNVIQLKRIPLIIEALSELPHDIKLRWVHFGVGPEFNNVIDQAEQLLSDNIEVEFMGHLPNAELLEWYRNESPDLFINVSSTEGIPVSIMEAMSFGIPVVATDVGGTSEIVNSDNGMLLPPGPSAKEVSEVIQLFYASPTDAIEAYKNNAYLTWEEKYNAHKNYMAFTELISQL